LSARSLAELAQRFGLDLADALAGDRELLADFLEGAIALQPNSEPHPEDLLFARGERREDLAGLFAEVTLDRGLDRRGRELVLDEVADRAFLFVTDRRLKRDWLPHDLERLLYVVERHLHLLGDILRPRLAAEPLDEEPRHAQELIDHLDHVDRNSDRAPLFRDRSRHRLPDPPDRVSRELVAALILELFHRAHQADVAFLDQVGEAEPTVGIALGQAHDQAQVGFGKFLLGALALVLSSGDSFERTRSLFAARLYPPFDLASRLLRLADPGGDIEQVLAAVVDLENAAAVFGLGGLLEELGARAAGRLLVMLDRARSVAIVAEQFAHPRDHRLHQAAREPHRAQLLLDALRQPHVRLLKLGLAPRPGPVVELLPDRLELRAQVLELAGCRDEAPKLALVGFGTTLLAGLRLLGVLEQVAQIGIACFDVFAALDHEIERDGRAQNFLFDLVLASLDPLGYIDFLLLRQKLEVAHLLEVEAGRVGRLAQRIGGSPSSFLGFLFGLGLEVGVGVLGGGYLFKHLDIEVLEAVKRRAQIGRRGDVLRQVVVDLLEGQVPLLPAKVDEPLQIRALVLLFHALKWSAVRRSSQARRAILLDWCRACATSGTGRA